MVRTWRQMGQKTKEILFKDAKVREGLENYFSHLEAFSKKDAEFKGLRSAEPVGVFDALVQPKDANVDTLRAMTREAPGQATKLGRAWLENVFGKMTSQGGVNHADALWSAWRDLGPQTKEILFSNPKHRADLQNFFLGLKKIAENPNPSGSGLVGWIGAQSAALSTGGGLRLLDPSTIGTYLLLPAGISKILHSPAGVRLLTQGIIPGSGKNHAAANIAAQLLRIAGDGAQKIGPEGVKSNGRP
jgi:hypothetical protein